MKVKLDYFEQILDDYTRFRNGALRSCVSCTCRRHEECERSAEEGRGCTCFTCFLSWGNRQSPPVAWSILDEQQVKP